MEDNNIEINEEIFIEPSTTTEEYFYNTLQLTDDQIIELNQNMVDSLNSITRITTFMLAMLIIIFLWKAGKK